MTLVRTRPSLLTLNKSINNNEFSDTLVLVWILLLIMTKYSVCNPTITPYLVYTSHMILRPARFGL